MWMYINIFFLSNVMKQLEIQPKYWFTNGPITAMECLKNTVTQPMYTQTVNFLTPSSTLKASRKSPDATTRK